MTRASAPLAVTLALDEALLRRPIGGPAVMAGQLRYLADLAALPNVSLRMLPFGVGTSPRAGHRARSPCWIPAQQPRRRHRRGHRLRRGLTGELYLDKPHELHRYRDAYAAILGCSWMRPPPGMSCSRPLKSLSNSPRENDSRCY